MMPLPLGLAQVLAAKLFEFCCGLSFEIDCAHSRNRLEWPAELTAFWGGAPAGCGAIRENVDASFWRGGGWATRGVTIKRTVSCP